jgi:hypothetical protein
MRWSAHVTSWLGHNGERHAVFAGHERAEGSTFAAKSNVAPRLRQPSTRAPNGGELE